MSNLQLRKWLCCLAAPTLLLLLFVPGAIAQGSQMPNGAAKASMAAGPQKIKQAAQVPLSDVALLQARVDDLQREVDALKAQGFSNNVGPVQRVTHDRKADQSGVTRSDIDALWNQIDKVITTLDQLTRKH